MGSIEIKGRSETRGACPQSSVSHMQQQLQVLVVEDNRALCRVIQVVMEKAGYVVHCAYDGEAAFEIVQAKSIDLIITDKQMPKMEGDELIKRTRNLGGEYSSMPIFLLTAKGLDLDLPAIKEELGIAGVFSKPFSPTELVAAVNECLATTYGLTKQQ